MVDSLFCRVNTLTTQSWTLDEVLKAAGEAFTPEGSVATAIALSPDGGVLAVKGTGKKLYLWDTAANKVQHAFPFPSQGREPSLDLHFSPEGTLLLGGFGFAAPVCGVDLKTGKDLPPLDFNPPPTQPISLERWITTQTISPDGKLLAAAHWPEGQAQHSGTCTLALWSLSTGKELLRFPGHRERIISLAFAPDGKQLASGGGGDRNHPRLPGLKLWDLTTGKERATLKGACIPLALTPDDKILATGCLPKEVLVASYTSSAKLWDVAMGKELATVEVGRHEHIESLTFAPDGKTLASVVLLCDIFVATHLPGG